MVKTGTKRISTNKGKPIQLVEVDGGCIICTSHCVNDDGYHRVYNGKGAKPRQVLLHRSTWEVLNGTVPDGYELDHLCKNRRCCNPAHLQLLTRSEHKTKTNLERYRERIDLIKLEIGSNISVKDIAKKYGVTEHTVNRHKRMLKETENGIDCTKER